MPVAAVVVLALALPSQTPNAPPQPTSAGPDCAYSGSVSWDGPRSFLALLACNESDPHQQWSGATLTPPAEATATATASVIVSGATGECLSTVSHNPVRIVPCAGDETRWVYNPGNQTIAVSTAAHGTLAGKGVGACIDINGGTGPVVDIWTCHPPGDRDAPNQMLVYNRTDQSIRSPHPALAGKCVSLNRTAMNPYVSTPCRWPNHPPQGLPVPQSSMLQGITILENATVIPYFGADTFYPAEDRFGDFFTGFDDGGLGGGGSSSVTVSSSSPTGFGSTTGSAIVSGGRAWRNLSVVAVGGALVEDGYPMLGRYTSANIVINGTWWTGTYGLGVSSQACPTAQCPGSRTNSLSLEVGPFVGFRHSINRGKNWSEPVRPDGTAVNVSSNLFRERAAEGPPTALPRGNPAGVKYGSPHVVDHGAENRDSPDGGLYMVAGGCLQTDANENCTWISGDGIFVARASGFEASVPDSLNDRANWEFWGGAAAGWTKTVARARPTFTWRGRVGAVTATWHRALRKYFFCVTAPSTHAWNNVGPFDTYILEASTLTSSDYRLVSYMPRFGMQAYFVSMPSAWLGTKGPAEEAEGTPTERETSTSASTGTTSLNAVLTFSANFACQTEGCAPNILNAGHGANLLPVRLLAASA